MPADDPFAPLFASDLAQQVKESFEEMIGFGASTTAATQETIARFRGALEDPHDGPVTLLALAALQIGQREIDSSIRDAALEILHSGDADRLIAADPTARRQVRAILDDLQALLESLEVEEDDDDEEEDEGDEDEI